MNVIEVWFIKVGKECVEYFVLDNTFTDDIKETLVNRLRGFHNKLGGYVLHIGLTSEQYMDDSFPVTRIKKEDIDYYL